MTACAASTFAREVKRPSYIAMNYGDKSFFVSSFDNHTITKITSSGTVSTFAGTGKIGKTDGVSAKASFYNPRGITIDQQTGTLFVADYSNHLIRRVSPQGEVSTLAGSEAGFADGNGKNTKFNNPWGLRFDTKTQSLIVCDRGNNKLRRIYLNGDVKTICEFQQPILDCEITSDAAILVSTYSQILLATKIGQGYEVTVLAGSDEEARVDGKPHESRFKWPYGLALHEPSHTCFVSDGGNHAIRKVSFVNVD